MTLFSRRILLSLLGVAGLGLLARRWQHPKSEGKDMIQKHFKLDFQWQTQEPFLFCVHHYDFYPKGNANFGPDPKYFQGRDMGQDFAGKDGFRMYHGEEIPGFPVHPHRGFETITIVRKGYVDHADSLGAAGRYGQGDVQWMTAGSGVQHSEMFPLLKQNEDNTLELFQIWLNLPQKSKMVAPHFKMFWSEQIPTLELDNKKVILTIVAGDYEGTQALKPPPDSWASQEESNTAIWLLKIKSGGKFKVPAAEKNTARSFYIFEGKGVLFNSQAINEKRGYYVDAGFEIEISSQDSDVEILMLQSRPIGEPVVQYGPFVMNSESDIRKTISDYQKTQFGGWPWQRHDMFHGPEIRRFAVYPDGRKESPTS